ncbi:MAG: triose-phosphate isomerase [Myxococcota bacterium]|nr:triose-phosphate isomerase [Myxococcota bacterium]
MRRPIIAGNWKMQGTTGEAVLLARELMERLVSGVEPEVVIAPPATALVAVKAAIAGSAIAMAAQNLHWEPRGAFTGEISAEMVVDTGCSHVIVGHSERRQLFGETDASVNRKVIAALASGLTPIVCVGETLEQREAGATRKVVLDQVDGALAGLDAEASAQLVLAYEPVWAIGTGLTATPEQAQEVHGWIRGQLAETAGAAVAEGMRILYGGSVKPSNVSELMHKPDLDGALVGGASLKADSFEQIVRFERMG